MYKKLNSADSSGRSPRFLLLMPPEIRHAIERAAIVADRTLTAEINLRLRESLNKNDAPKTTGAAIAAGLPLSYTAPHTPTVHVSNDNGPESARSDLDGAMLAVFRSLPVEKQLALLSLLK